MFKNVIRYISLFLLVVISTLLIMLSPAFAATSVEHGWIALDSNKKPVLNGSQYVLSSGTAQPVKFITDAQTVKAVPAKSVAYLNNKKAGTATVLIIGDRIPGFKDAFITTFTVINTIDIAKASIANIANQTYTGGKISPGITVKYGNTTLKKDKDYKISYGANTNVGKGSVTIQGIGSYAGSKTVNFNIVKANLNKASIASIANQTYTGSKISPGITVKYGKTTLKKDKDYKISYGANTNVGKGSVSITGIGGYTGSKTASFNIGKANINNAGVSGVTSLYTDALSIKAPTPHVSYKGKNLTAGKDYTVLYTDVHGNAINPQRPGAYQVAITGIGSFNGVKRVGFQLINQGDDLARFACLLSYSKRQIYEKTGCKGTKRFIKAINANVTKSERKSEGSHYTRGCDFVVCTICRTSGYDKKVPFSLQEKQKKYFGYGKYSPKTTRWKKIGKYKLGYENSGKMQPGDIVVTGNHIWMYVGHDIIMEVYNNYLRGTDADKGVPAASSAWVSGSYHTSFSACICTRKQALASSGTVYRCVSPQQKVVFSTYARTGAVTY